MKIVWVVGAAVLATWLWLFRAPLLSGEVCALRDSGNFYYPLFAWQCDEWFAGRIPLWNQFDGLGVPSHSDATASVFYPLKIVFALPLPFHLRFSLYIAVHFLIAAGTLYFVARCWNLSEASAGVGALSYAFGGYVLSQHCNVVFLVSAAWLPLAIWFAEAMLVRRSPHHAIAFGAILAVMVYGGDPQTAYHAGLLAVLYALLLQFGKHESSSTGKIWNSRPMLLAIAAVASFGFAAIQVLPAWEWTLHSDRVVTELPRSIYELGAHPHRAELNGHSTSSTEAAVQGLFGTPQPNSHARYAYFYSFGPWRLMELLWPNISGRNYPTHHRWLSMLPAEGKVWMPSVYFGLIPLLGAMTAWRWKGATARDRWLISCVVVGLAGSFGWYGLGWLVQELRVAATGDSASHPWIGQQVGGLYWSLTTLLPAYAYFRFPAKWFVIAAVGFSLLAARGVEQILNGDTRARRLPHFVGLGSIVALTALVVFHQPLLALATNAAVDDLYGPLNADGAWLDAAMGTLHVIVGCFLVRVIYFAFSNNPPASSRGNIVGISLVLLTAIDLAVANTWLIATVPHAIFDQPMSLTPTGSDESSPPVRVAHQDVLPRAPVEWSQRGETNRLSEIVAWERKLLMYRHHLESGVASLDAPMTIRSGEWATFLREARQQISADTDHRFPAFDWLGVDYVISESGTVDQQAGKLPRASFVAASAATLAGPNLPEPDPTLGSCRILHYSARRVEIEVDLKSPALLVLTDSYDPNWQVSTKAADSSVETKLPIEKVRGIVRGVSLPTGKQIVAFTFRPMSLMWGAGITLASVIVALVTWSRTLRIAKK